MVRRGLALLVTMFVMVVASIVWAVAAPPASAAPARAPGGACSVEEWQQDFKGCVNRLTKVSASRASCLKPPTPSTPDSGLAGWFAERPASSSRGSISGQTQ